MKGYVLLVVLLVLASNVAAVGVSPPRILLESVPKGSTVEKSVILSGVAPGDTLTTTLDGEGAAWVAAKLGTSVLVEREGDIDFPFVLSIPAEAPNGKYRVTAQIVTSPQQESTRPNSAVVSSGVMVELEFSISGEEVRNYRIANVEIPASESGNGLSVLLQLHNEGNVLARPERVELVVKSAEKETITTATAASITQVAPYTVGESVAIFDLQLDPGFYFGDISIQMEAGSKEVTDLPFDVFERGTFKADGELLSVEVQENVERLARIDASFRNKGEIDLSAKLKGEIYRGGALIDTFESEPEYVRRGETKQFTHYYTVQSGGAHTVKAYAAYSGKRSEARDAAFTAAGGEEGRSLLMYGVMALLLFIVLLLLRRRRG